MIPDNSVLNSGSDHVIDVIDDVLSIFRFVDIIVSFLGEFGLSLITDHVRDAMEYRVTDFKRTRYVDGSHPSDIV